MKLRARIMGTLLVAGAAAVLGTISTSMTACLVDFNEPDGGIRATTILAPDQKDFAMVSPVLEHRCATLDCHGQVGRPLRLYSGNGLRIPNDAGNLPGTNPTTPDEITANYRSVIGLEPEEMTRVIAGEDPPRSLLLLKKPLLLEAHKGGPAFAPSGDPGETCITSWIQGTVDQTACNAAIAGY
jgi:hypothetical protein